MEIQSRGCISGGAGVHCIPVFGEGLYFEDNINNVLQMGVQNQILIKAMYLPLFQIPNAPSVSGTTNMNKQRSVTNAKRRT